MRTSALAAMAFAVLYVAVAVTGFVHSRQLSASRRMLLGILRMLLLILLLIAYLRPGFAFRRLAVSNSPPVVLLDNSRSMRFFAADSLWDTLIRPAIGHTGATVLLFGDSLRPLHDGLSPDFSDRRSYLPSGATLRRLVGPGRRIVLFTDGNWSNARIPAGFLSDYDVVYLELPGARRRARLALELPDRRVESVEGDTAKVHAVVSGELPQPAEIIVSCVREGAIAAKSIRRSPGGFFRDTLVLPLLGRTIGHYHCRLTASCDTLSVSSHFVHTVLPRKLTAGVYCSVGSLDCRFLSRALRRAGGWRVTPVSRAPGVFHLIVLIDWQENDLRLTDKLIPGGAILLVGPPRDSRDSVCLSGECRLTTPQSPTAAEILPPAFTVVPAPRSVFRGELRRRDTQQRSLLVAACRRCDGKQDTLPLLSATSVGGREVFLLAADGVWRWDFLTQLIPETQGIEHPFSRYILAYLREKLIGNLSNHLAAFPAISSPSESRELPLCILLPSDIGSHTVQLRLSLYTPGSDTVFDTVLAFSPLGTSKTEVVIPPCAAGTYTYTVSLRYPNGRTVRYTDSLTVGPDLTEMLVDGQNVPLLEQVARPLSCSTSTHLHALLSTHPQGLIERTVVSTVNVEHTWALLAILLAFFSLEWILRRQWALD